MKTNFRRHDTTAQSLSALDRQAYAREKAALIADRAVQSDIDERLNAFFWKCFEDDAEDEGDDRDD